MIGVGLAASTVSIQTSFVCRDRLSEASEKEYHGKPLIWKYSTRTDGTRKAKEKANRPFLKVVQTSRADSLLSISTVQEVSIYHTHSGFSVLTSLKSPKLSHITSLGFSFFPLCY